MTLDFPLRPGNAERFEHSEISAQVGSVGIEKRAVPIENNNASGETGSIHGAIHDEAMVSEKKKGIHQDAGTN